ncbi:hypothetical protein, partial [Frankia sp. AvcI1]
DVSRLRPLIDGPPERLEWGQRLSLERVVDLALWLDHHHPELTL